MAEVLMLSSVHIALDNRVFYREARSLAAAGHDVTLVAVHDRTEDRDGVQIVPLPRLPRWQRPRLWVRLLGLVLRRRPDVVHLHDPELLLLVPVLRVLTRAALVYDVHEDYPDFVRVKDYIPARLRGPVARFVAWVEPLLARGTSALVFADEATVRRFDHLPQAKVVLFNYPGADVVERGRACTVEGRSPVVLYLGGMERNRGTALMIEAFAAVHRRRPDARLWLVGHFAPPTLEAEVAAHADRCGVGDVVTITGRVPFTDIGSYLARAAVGWVPWQPARKNHKNIPTKLFEYMSHGLPIVASDLASTRPFVTHGGNGLLVPATRPDAHAEAILRILDDSSGAATMGRAGQRLVAERYNWARMERRLLDLYDSLVGS